MEDIKLFIIVLVFNLAILFSLASIGNIMYRRVIASRDYTAITKLAVVVLVTISAFLILLFVMEMALRMIEYVL